MSPPKEDVPAPWRDGSPRFHWEGTELSQAGFGLAQEQFGVQGISSDWTLLFLNVPFS